MYYESCPHCLVETVKEFPIITLAKANEVYKSVIADIKGGVIDPLHPELFDLYKNNYHKAIRSVFGQPEYGSRYFEHAAKFELNTARFAAYKSHYATQTLIKSFEAAPEKFAMNSGKILKQFARWQATEYNTTVARCRTAKQFEQFQAEAHLYPNLEWLATRSATPRELHLSFVGIVLPMDDPFWNENQPGNLYNCKCDWKTTDAPTTGSPVKVVKPSPGLEGNPAKSGEIFTDKHPYMQKVKNPEAVEKYVEKYVLQNFSIEKTFENGGVHYIHPLVEKTASDFKDVSKIVSLFAEAGEKAYHLPIVHYKNQLYKYIFEGAHNRKCPDIRVGNKFYEYESFEKPFRKNSLKHMISNGFKQSERVIIDINETPLTTRDILSRLNGYMNQESSKTVEELWVKTENHIYMIYPKITKPK